MTPRMERIKYLKERIKEVEERITELERQLHNESNTRLKLSMQNTLKTNREVLKLVKDSLQEVLG